MINKGEINTTFDFATDPPESLKPSTNQLHGMTSVRNDLFWQAAISEIQARIEKLEAIVIGNVEEIEKELREDA